MPESPQEKYDLDKLLSQIEEDNIHAEIDMGQAVGNEIFWDDSTDIETH